MASPPRGAAPTAEPPSSPRFEQQHHHEQRPHGSPLASPGGTLSAPHSTVAGAAEATPGTSLVPSSPDSGSSCSAGIRSPPPVGPARPTSPGVSCSAAAPGGGNDGSEREGRKDNAAAVVCVDPDVSRLNVDVGVEAGSGAVVRWVCGSAGGGVEGAGDGREALALSGRGRGVDGQGQQQEAEGGGREGTGGPALSGAPSRTNLTLTIVSDEVDEPQVTRLFPPDGGCCEKKFDRPGSYTYYVCSGPLTMGRVVATALACQPQSAAITVASSPPACLKDSDAGEEGVGGPAASRVTSAKSDTALGGHSYEVGASQDETEWRSAATEEGDLEMVKPGGEPGQDQETGVAHEAVAANILDVADANQTPLVGAEMLMLSSQDSPGGGQCTAVGGHSSEVCASQDERECRSAATEEGDPEMVKTGGEPGQDQEPGVAHEAVAEDILGVADSKQSPLEGTEMLMLSSQDSSGGGQCTAVGSHSSEVCASQDERVRRSAATEEDDPEMVKTGGEPGQDQETGVPHKAVAADILDVADAKQSALEGAEILTLSSQDSVEGGKCTAVDGHSSDMCASQDERECRSAATEEGGPEMVKAGDSPDQDQEPGVAHEDVAADILDVTDTKRSPLECASVEGGHCTAVDGHSPKVCASHDETECHSAATEAGDPEVVKTGDSPGQDQEPGVAHEAVAADVLDVADAKQSPLKGVEIFSLSSQDSLGGGPCTAVDGHSSEVCASQDEKECCSAAAEECNPEMVKTGGEPGQDQEPGVAPEAVVADFLHVADAKQSPLEGAEMLTLSSQDSVECGQCIAVDGHSSDVCTSQDKKECCSAAAEECEPQTGKTGGLPGQDQEHGVSREAVAADILAVADAKQSPLEGAEILALSSLVSLGDGQCVDAALGAAEEVAEKRAAELPGAQSSGGDGASESRVEEKQTPNNSPPPSVPLSPGEENSERSPLQVADQEEQAPNHPSPSLPLSRSGETSKRLPLQEAEQEEQAPDHPSPSVPLSPGEGNSKRLPLQGAEQDGFSLAGVPELESAGYGDRNQPPMSAVATSVSSAQRNGGCDRDERQEGKGDNEGRSAVDHRREIGNGVELYISSEGSDPDRTMTPKTNSPASIRRSTVDDVVFQPSDGGEDSALSDIAVFEEGGPCQNIAAGERTTEGPSEFFPRQHLQAFMTPDHAEDSFARGGSGSNSCDSDDAPRASCVGGGDTPNAGRGRGAWERPSSPVSPPTPLSVLPTTDTPDRERGGTSLRLAGSATEAAPRPQRSPQDWRGGRHRVEVMQRDGSGQEWKEISPLTSPVVAGGPGGNFGSFICPEDATPSAPPTVSDRERKEQGSEETTETAHGVDDVEEQATPSVLEEAKVVVVGEVAPLPEVDTEWGGTIQTAMEALDVPDGEGSVKASYAIFPSTAPLMGAAEDNFGGVLSDSVDEAAAETGTAPSAPEGTVQTVMEALDVVFDVKRSRKASRAVSPSTAPPMGVSEYIIGDVSSDSADEAAAETATAPNAPEGTAMEALDVSDGDGATKSLRVVAPSTAPPMGAEANVGDVSSDSADEAVAETGTTPNAPEGTMQTAMEALDVVFDSAGSLKVSRAASPSTAPPMGAVGEDIGDVSSDSADEAAAETATAPNAPEGTAMGALDISDSDGSAKSSRVVFPSTTAPPMGAKATVGDVSFDSADETAAETGTTPNAPEGTAMEAHDVSDDDGSAKASRVVSPSTAPPMGAEANAGDVSSDSADQAAAKTGTAPNAPEGTAMEALDVSDGDSPAKVSRVVSPSTTVPPMGEEANVGDVFSDYADETAEETGTARNAPEGTLQTVMEALDVSDGDGSANASRATSSSTAPPTAGAEEDICDASSGSADEAAAEAGAAPNEPEGTMPTAIKALDVSDGDDPAKASRATSSSTVSLPVGVGQDICDVSSGSAGEAAAETGTAHNAPQRTLQTAMEALDVSDGDGSVQASRAVSPSTSPPPVGAEEDISDVSSGSADEASAEKGTTPNEPEGAVQTAMKALDVSDDDGSAKASRVVSPSTAPPMGAEANFGDVSSDYADEAAGETGTAPNAPEGTMQTAMKALDLSNDDDSPKASRAISPSEAPPVGAEEDIGDVSSDSAHEAAAEAGTAPNESEGTVQTAMEALDVSNGEDSPKASRAISPSAARSVGAEEDIGDVSSDSAEEAAAEAGTAPNESEGTVQTAMEALDVSDGEDSPKASRATSPSTEPPVGAGENVGDVSPDSVDEAAAEAGTAPNESEAVQTAMETINVSDGEESPKASRAISPAEVPSPVGADENVGDVSSTDEPAAEAGTAPNEAEGARQTAMEALDVSDGEDSPKASRAIPPSTVPSPVGAEDNIGDVSPTDEPAAEAGAAPNETEGAIQTAMEALDVSDGDGSVKASLATSPSTVPPPLGADESIGDVSFDSIDEAAAETGTASSSPADGDLPRLPTGSTVKADANEGDQCCESVDTPLPSAAVKSADVALKNLALEKASPASASIESGGDCIHTMVVGDDSVQPFQPEVVTVPVGARVMWKRCSGASNDDEPEVFNVRQGCPIVETGWRAEFSFSIGGAQPTFTSTFERAGRFVISSDASPPGADRKRGEVVVESEAGHSDSDSFASPDDARTSSEGFASGNEGSSFTPRGDNEGGFGDGSPHLAPSSMTGSPRASQHLISNSCGSPASDGVEGCDCDDRGVAAAPSPTESSGDLHNSSTTAEPVRNCVGSALVFSGLAIPPCVAVTGTEMQAVEPPFPTRRRHRSLPPISGAHGTSYSRSSELSDERGWVPPDRLSVLEWSKGAYVASETQLSPVAATSHECLRSPGLLSDTHAAAALRAMRENEPYRGGVGGGGGGADCGIDCGVSDTDVDDDGQSLAIAFAAPNELRAEANAQVKESFESVSSAFTPSAAPDDGKDELEEPPQQVPPEAGGTVQVEYEGEAAAALSSARLQEDERTAQPPPKISQSKKKKAKKKKKKSGGAGSCGGGGSLGGDGGGSRTSRGNSVDTSKKMSVGEDNSALLLDEETFFELFGDGATGVGGGSGKTSAKTLIVGDQGFKPWKPVVVQVGATVSIKAANVWPNGGIGQDRALSISLVGPIVNNEETRRFFEGSNKAEDMPDERRFKKTAPFGRALVAVLRKRGEYWLIDHLAGKRIKVTAMPREAAVAPVAQIEPGQPTPSGKQRSTSLPRNADSAEATLRRGGNNGGEVASRSKKKVRGNDKSNEAIAALAKLIDATTSAGDPVVALKSAEVTGPAVASESARDLDLPASDARGMVDKGCGEVRTTASTATTVEGDLLGQVQERAPSSPWLPPIRVMRDGDLSMDDFGWFRRFDAVHVVRVSHKKGFEPATLEMGFSPDLGALVICELDAKQRVTQEVLCRWLPGGARDASGAAKGQGGVGAGTASRAVAAGNDVEADSQTELSTRLGPGSLKKCHFVLGRFGEYQLSYRHDGKRGLAVVVKPPSVHLASLASAPASNTSVAREAGLAADSSGQVQPPEGPRGPGAQRLLDQMPETAERNSSPEIAGKDGKPNSVEARSDEDSACTALSGSTTSSAEMASHETRPIDGSGLASTQVQQGWAEDKSAAVVAAERGGGFCWEDAMMPGRDQDQGDFVQQRSHVKNIKRKKVKSERAEAAKNAAAAAATLLEAAAATAEAATAEAAVGKPTCLDEAALTGRSAVPTEPSATETSVPAATGLPTDKPTLEEPRAAKTSTWEASLSEAGSQRATVVDKLVSSVNSCPDHTPPNSPVVSAKAGLEDSTSLGAAVVDKDALSNPPGESGRVEPSAAKPTSLGPRKTRKKFDGDSLDSPRRSPPAEPAAIAATGLKKTQRKREGGERKSGGVHVAASARNSAGAKPIKPAQEMPVAEETAATAVTGWGDAISGASWNDDVGPTQPEVRAGALPEGGNASRAARASPRPYAHQSLAAAPPRVPHRRWDTPRGTAFSQPHAPPQSSHGRGWTAPISGGSAAPATSNWGGASTTAPLVSTGDRNNSPSCVEGGGRGVIQKGGAGTALDGSKPVALAASSAEVPGLAGSAQTVGVSTSADSKDNARVVGQPSTFSRQGNVAGRANASTEAHGVGGVGGVSGGHVMAGDRATDTSHEEGGSGYGRRSRPGAESTRISSRTSAHSRSSSFSSSPSEPTPSAGSNVTTSKKSKKKARAERKAANAAAGAVAVVGESAFSGGPNSSATLEPPAGQPHAAASTKTTARPAKARKGDSQAGSSSRSGISFGDFVLPAKTAAGRAAGAFGLSAPGRRDAAGDRAPASTPGSSGRAGAGHGRRGEKSGVDEKKVAASAEDAKLGQTPRGRPGPARSETAGGWGGADAAPVLKPASAGVSALPSGLGDRPAARPPPYEQLEDKEEESASEGGAAGNPEAPTGAALPTGVVASPTAARSPKKISDPPSEKREGPRWGNCSTKVSFEERTRRSQAIRGIRLPRGHRREGRVKLRPAAFPEASRLPGGGYSVPDGPDDRLPPPSAYELEESARMMKVYDDMMERLNTTGLDEELPNGFAPKIYDLTSG